VAGSIHILRGLAETLLRGSGESLSQALGADDSASTALARELDALIEEARSDPRTASMMLETGELSAALLRRLEDTRVGKQFDRFLTRHGARALYESDSAIPRYREDPTPLLYALRRGLEEAPSGNVAAVEPARPAPPSGESRQPLRAVLGRALLRRLGRLYALRQDVRAGIVSLIAAQRCWELALGERWAARGWLDEPADYFMLTLADAERAASAPGPEPARWLRERLARNRARQEEWAATPMPLTWTDDASPQVAAPLPNADAAELLRGIPISPGVADGCVAVLRHAEEARTIPPGAILVAPQAGPAWAPLYTRAAGLVVEVGGVLSHGSILAREYGLPAVANIAGITAVLRDGEWVRVDGSRGVVYRLDGAPEHPSAGPEQSASDQYAGIDEDEWDEEEADEWSETRRW
jgi:pyruvate,water dikinase